MPHRILRFGKNKKAFVLIKGRKLKTLFVLPPFFVFASPQKPLRVQTYPAAVTGGPVAALPKKRARCATPRPSSAWSVRFPFSNRKISVTPSHAYSSFHRLLPCLVDVVNYTLHQWLCQYLFSNFLRNFFCVLKCLIIFIPPPKVSLPLRLYRRYARRCGVFLPFPQEKRQSPPVPFPQGSVSPRESIPRRNR